MCGRLQGTEDATARSTVQATVSGILPPKTAGNRDLEFKQLQHTERSHAPPELGISALAAAVVLSR